MDSTSVIVVGAEIFSAPGAHEGLIIGVVTAVAACSIFGTIGLILVRKVDTPKLPMLLQLPGLILGIIAAILGLVLSLTNQSPGLALGLLAGGLLALTDSGMLLFVIGKVHRQTHQAMNKTGNRRGMR